jgi:hypothetical protein
VRCSLKPDHPLDHTTYGGVQFAKFTEIVSNGGAVRVPQQGALNDLTDEDVARIVADARDCISRFHPGGKIKNADGTFSERRGRGFEYRVSLCGEKFVQVGDRPTFVPPRLMVNGEKRWIPFGVSDADVARAWGVSEIAINEARREADVRSLISLEFNPSPMADIPDSLESAIAAARAAQTATMALPRRGDPEAGTYGRPVALDLGGRPSGAPVTAAATGTRFVGDPTAAAYSSVSDEAQAAAVTAATTDRSNGIPPLQPSPDMGVVKDAGFKVGGTGKPRR